MYVMWHSKAYEFSRNCCLLQYFLMAFLLSIICHFFKLCGFCMVLSIQFSILGESYGIPCQISDARYRYQSRRQSPYPHDLRGSYRHVLAHSQEIESFLIQQVSDQTVRRRLQQYNMSARRPWLRLLLTVHHRQAHFSGESFIFQWSKTNLDAQMASRRVFRQILILFTA